MINSEQQKKKKTIKESIKKLRSELKNSYLAYSISPEFLLKPILEIIRLLEEITDIMFDMKQPQRISVISSSEKWEWQPDATVLVKRTVYELDNGGAELEEKIISRI